MKTIINGSDHLGKVIRDARKAQGMSQDDLAGMTGTGRRFISDLENGKDTAQLGKTLDVLKTLGMSLSTDHKWKLK